MLNHNGFYHKIKLTLEDIPLPEIKTDILVEKYAKKSGVGLYYYQIKDQYRELLKNKLPQKLHDQIRILYCEFISPGSIVPHRDHGVLTGLNYYFQPSDGITTWYRIKEGAQPYRHDEKTTNNLFKERDLELVDQFIAQENECYLLNVNNIHNVLVPNNNNRLFICWHWSYLRFEEVLTILHNEGYV